jgi:hypothetical protein
MIIRTRTVETTEYVANCEVCDVRIVLAVPGPQRQDITALVGSQVALCPDCGDKGELFTPWLLEEDYLEAIHGTLNP